jgi:hypothetical protein
MGSAQKAVVMLHNVEYCQIGIRGRLIILLRLHMDLSLRFCFRHFIVGVEIQTQSKYAREVHLC